MGPSKGWGPEGWGPNPRKMGPRRVGPPRVASKGGGPKRVGPRKGGAPKGWGIERVGPRKGGAPKGWAPKGWGPERVGGPKGWGARRFFFPLPPPFRSFCVYLSVFSEFWWLCLKRRGSQMCTFGALGLSCEAPAAPLKLKCWTLSCQERFEFGAGDPAVCKKAYIILVLIDGDCNVMRVSVVPGKLCG